MSESLVVVAKSNARDIYVFHLKLNQFFRDVGHTGDVMRSSNVVNFDVKMTSAVSHITCL